MGRQPRLTVSVDNFVSLMYRGYSTTDLKNLDVWASDDFLPAGIIQPETASIGSKKRRITVASSPAEDDQSKIEKGKKRQRTNSSNPGLEDVDVADAKVHGKTTAVDDPVSTSMGVRGPEPLHSKRGPTELIDLTTTAFSKQNSSESNVDLSEQGTSASGSSSGVVDLTGQVSKRRFLGFIDLTDDEP
jgi:hypothetical protein